MNTTQTSDRHTFQQWMTDKIDQIEILLQKQRNSDAYPPSSQASKFVIIDELVYLKDKIL